MSRSMKEEALAEAERLQSAARQSLDSNKLREKLDASNFSPNAVIRGAQLTLVGAHRALQNPALFTNDHYKQAAIAVVVGIGIRLAIIVPIFGIRILLWSLSWLISLDSSSWDTALGNGINFVEEYVLQVPFFLMALMRYIVPTLDNLFMQSLKWVDRTYVKKHRGDNPADLRDMYYPNLKLYRKVDGSTHSESTAQGLSMFLYRFARKGALSLAVYALSYVPFVGRLVLPTASLYTFKRAVGLGPAMLLFGTGIFLPRRYLVVFLQTYFSSRSLMRELLEPYFARIKFTKDEKRKWFMGREGVLFGFGLGFYILIKVPLVGVLVYGIAEASTAYLITKITDPPPVPSQMKEFTASQQNWRNQHEFLDSSLNNVDAIHDSRSESRSESSPEDQR